MDRPIEQSAVVEKYSASHEKMYMSLSDVSEIAHEISARARDLDLQPQAVVGIANGALMIAKIVADDLGVPLEIIRIRYRLSGVKLRLSKLRLFTRLLSLWYSRPILGKPIRRLVSMLRYNSIQKQGAYERMNLQGPVLLVDDAICSGRTIASGTQIIKHAGVQKIYTAVISYTQGIKRIEKDRIVPDIHISSVLHYFPWSVNNEEYEKFLLWISKNDLHLWK